MMLFPTTLNDYAGLMKYYQVVREARRCSCDFAAEAITDPIHEERYHQSEAKSLVISLVYQYDPEFTS